MAAMIPKLETLKSVVTFLNFKQCNQDVLSILKERGQKNLPTIFINMPSPSPSIRSELEKSLVFFLSDKEQEKKQNIVQEHTD